ncbi:segregation and condensation protein B [Marinilactibacillus psychrotolerans]|uniref:Segregation and condensation protein B n=1 Tax=Marinilactibacillus psychrotolerans TaxID=191770 RepID=A0A5R9C401_9LACT|nr:segregation and condensation protein B [Marinilactibacillus psychrotolerans]TLQ07561.1 segregation and condensation protein B [Marinilactibacillus psychrotolerans]
MFTVDDVAYTLKFNTKKLKTIEMVAKTSIIAQIAKNDGILQYQTLETLFSLALVEENTNEVVKQNEAVKMFEKLVETNGQLTVNGQIVEKLQEDLGFMFR